MFITPVRYQLRLLSRLNVVDNSEIGRQVKDAGKKVKIIHFYNKRKYVEGGLGDRVLVTILGQMKKGIVVGCTQTQKSFVPRFDRNNVVLMKDKDVPLGTRVTVPLPNILRKQGASTARLMSLATKFV